MYKPLFPQLCHNIQRCNLDNPDVMRWWLAVKILTDTVSCTDGLALKVICINARLNSTGDDDGYSLLTIWCRWVDSDSCQWLTASELNTNSLLSYLMFVESKFLKQTSRAYMFHIAFVKNYICPRSITVSYLFLWLCSPARAMASSSTRFLDHTQRRATVGRTPLDEWSARLRDRYLTTHTTDEHPCPPWDSNPRSQQASGLRPRGHWDRHAVVVY
jgi:hypothetical protein